MIRATLLTSSQRDTLAHLREYIKKHGRSPTLTELGKAFELRSLRSVTQRIESLERKGLIRRDRFKHRNIIIVQDASALGSSTLVEVPVIASAGCDAVDVYAQDEFGEFISIDKRLLPANASTNIAAIRAIGDSMQDAGINDGDYVIVEVTESVENGDRVVAIIGNMAVIKQFRTVNGVVFLDPQNSSGAYSPIIVKQEDSKIFGKVLSVISAAEWVDDIKVEYYPGYGRA